LEIGKLGFIWRLGFGDWELSMHLIIDGYNLLHTGHSLIQLNSIELQQKRDQLISRLSAYRQTRPCDITIVFDGWQGGWSTERKERKRGIELIFSRLGEKADEVIKQLIRQKGSGAIVITSDRDISRYAERMSVTVIPSDQFQGKMERASIEIGKEIEQDEEEERGVKRKGPSRRLSKKEKRAILALKKL
jgi:predicted RNA-binding protein with PIN domain